tara:strand:- start:1695 stop:2663 length:969 start_codon:yes stop_codon:yes gene_type:complete
MSKITIVGLGNVGLRHLEGCLKIKKINKIFAIDKERKKIEFCKKFLREKNNYNKIIFSSNLNKIKSDLAIISTNSKERLKITKQIIKKNKIKKLLLEKFLTNNLSNLAQFETLLTSSKIWINHIYRYQDAFIFLKKILKKKNFRKANITITGNNLNLGSNCIHFVDYVSFLMNDKVRIKKISFSKNSYWIKSKKKLYKDFIGEVKIYFENNLILNIKSKKNLSKISYSSHKLRFEEKIYKIKNLYNSQKSIFNFQNEQKEFACPYISNSTYKEIEKILLKKKNINLCKLKNIILVYSKIIEEFLKHYNHFYKKKNNKILPIT